jgi:hypothetical protein
VNGFVFAFTALVAVATGLFFGLFLLCRLHGLIRIKGYTKEEEARAERTADAVARGTCCGRSRIGVPAACGRGGNAAQFCEFAAASDPDFILSMF